MKAALILAPLLALTLAGCPAPAGTPAGTSSVPVATVEGVPAPPWPAPADPAARIKAAGLEAMAAESFVVHTHSHLDVFYNGAAVKVPAAIGIGTGFISPLHTHRETGVIHIESPKEQIITLGQFFTEWNVPLTGAKAYVNGAEVPDAAAVVLEDQQQITVIFGAAPATIPATYAGPWS